jgi:hypothetical protein
VCRDPNGKEPWTRPCPLSTRDSLCRSRSVVVINNILAKTVALRITLNIDGTPIVSTSHTHPSHTQTSRLLASSLSLGVPVPHTTQCIRDV